MGICFQEREALYERRKENVRTVIKNTEMDYFNTYGSIYYSNESSKFLLVLENTLFLERSCIIFLSYLFADKMIVGARANDLVSPFSIW